MIKNNISNLTFALLAGISFSGSVLMGMDQKQSAEEDNGHKAYQETYQALEPEIKSVSNTKRDI